ncbi:MAG: protein translocase subunit SecD [Verrucomicrobia bacterium]|nr:protein translocase subunit SecD [Verrucomicrobiota bacterium]
MKQNKFRFFVVLFFLAWSIWAIYPPTTRDLIEVFKDRAQRVDTNFNAIVQNALKLQQQPTNRVFDSLYTAIKAQDLGTNTVAYYFPRIEMPNTAKDPARYVLYRLQQEAAGKIRLGLDLQGGVSFLVRLDTNKVTGTIDKSRIVEQAVEVLRKRVDQFGVAEPLLQPAGEDRILIQLPGLSEDVKERARETIQKAAFLEFRMVHPDSDELLASESIAPGFEVLLEKPKSNDPNGRPRPHLVNKKPERGLTGKYIKDARVANDPISGRPEIDFELDKEGADLFAQITKEYSPRGNKSYFLAIVLDGELYSAPQIHGEITGGHAQITGTFDLKEAFDLATALRNPLEAPVQIMKEQSVDPSLGKDSIRSGLMASVVGTLAVAAFMIVYYMFAGLIADVALILNIIILLGVMCYIETTLTLPGIAGIVLTIGMAVDANVLIFERIREESAKGKSLRGALAAGYDRAFGTIFDSHVTTLISSIILIFMGSGPIKGFGMTLTIGVAASLFTALVVTRLIFDYLIGNEWLKSLPMLHMIRAVKLDFMKLAKPAFIISWSIIIVGLGYGIFARGEKMWGTDFRGGDELTMRFAQKVETDKLRAAIVKAGVNDPSIQFQKDLGGLETVRIVSPVNTAGKVEAAVKQEFPAAKFDRIALDKAGAVIGKETEKTAVTASLLSLFGILIYVAFRYEFSFAVGAVLAVIHDVLMTIGCYCLTGLFGDGREFNATMVAAVLTIIGFSINDTIVIFDRIREDLKLGVRGSFKEVINQALNQTLSRTIITSGTVFLATMALYIFGGRVINDFAFTFLVGIITGTYSSIYIASALVLWWHKGERPKSAPTAQVVQERAVVAK